MSEIKSSNKNKSESTSLQKRNTPVSSLKLIEIETQKNDNNEKENKQLPNSTGDKNRKYQRRTSAGKGHVLKERNCQNQEQDEGKVKIIIDELLKQKMSPKLLLERMQLSEICCQKSVQFIRKLMLETGSSKKRRKMEDLIQMLDFTKESLHISRQERSTIGQNLKKLEKRIYILTLHIRRQNKFIESLESRVKQARTWDKYLESEKRFFEGANAYIETEPKDFRLVDFSQQWNQQQSRKHNIFSERHIKFGSQSSEEESVRSQENLSAKKSLRLRPEVYNIHLSSNGAQLRNNSQEQISNIVHELRRMNRSLQEHLQTPRLSRLNQSPIVELRQQQRRQNSRLGHQQSIAEQIDLISDPPVVLYRRRQIQQIDNQNLLQSNNHQAHSPILRLNQIQQKNQIADLKNKIEIMQKEIQSQTNVIGNFNYFIARIKQEFKILKTNTKLLQDSGDKQKLQLHTSLIEYPFQVRQLRKIDEILFQAEYKGQNGSLENNSFDKQMNFSVSKQMNKQINFTVLKQVVNFKSKEKKTMSNIYQMKHVLDDSTKMIDLAKQAIQKFNAEKASCSALGLSTMSIFISILNIIMDDYSYIRYKQAYKQLLRSLQITQQMSKSEQLSSTLEKAKNTCIQNIDRLKNFEQQLSMLKSNLNFTDRQVRQNSASLPNRMGNILDEMNYQEEGNSNH